MPSKSIKAQLLVEGKNDQHVVWALCKKHNIQETFSVETPGADEGGIDKLLESIPIRLKIPNLTALGIMLDADQNIDSRWQSVKNRLEQAGYSNLPNQPESQGTIILNPERPRVGIWIMPNNELTGSLESFVTHLIPEADKLVSKVEFILQNIESENLNQYPLAQHAKAYIHTWLAWQKVPGQPMGQAITAHVLNYNASLALSFVRWLKRLFEEVD